MQICFPGSPEDIRRQRAAILARLTGIDGGFSRIPVPSIRQQTLNEMLRLYDDRFFRGQLVSSYCSLTVSMSSRLLKSAGKFIHPTTRSYMVRPNAEIRMSSDFLFRLNKGPFRLNGLTVSTPQEAFLVVFEHELIHAVEFIAYGNTGHSARFLRLAGGYFGHTETTHSLPTRETEARKSGIQVGSTVSFVYEGRRLTGMVGYVGKTATVFVPDPKGSYRDRKGNRFLKFRVSLPLLTLASKITL